MTCRAAVDRSPESHAHVLTFLDSNLPAGKGRCLSCGELMTMREWAQGICTGPALPPVMGPDPRRDDRTEIVRCSTCAVPISVGRRAADLLRLFGTLCDACYAPPPALPRCAWCCGIRRMGETHVCPTAFSLAEKQRLSGS